MDAPTAEYVRAKLALAEAHRLNAELVEVLRQVLGWIETSPEGNEPKKIPLADGLYRVEWPERKTVAGFVVKDGRLVTCAPILRRWIKGQKGDWPSFAALLREREIGVHDVAEFYPVETESDEEKLLKAGWRLLMIKSTFKQGAWLYVWRPTRSTEELSEIHSPDRAEAARLALAQMEKR